MNDRQERSGTPVGESRPAARMRGVEEVVDLPSTLRLVDYLEALWRRKGFLLGASMGMALLAALVAAGKPNVYRSQARLMVSAPREALDASRALGLTRGQTPFSPADSAIAVLQSRDLMERVAVRLGPQTVLDGQASWGEEDAQVKGLKGWLLPLMRIFQRGVASAGSDFEPTIERAVASLRSSMTTYGDQRSPAILVVCRASSPRRAQTILDAFVEEGLRFYIELRSSESDRLFVEEQRARAIQEAQETQEAYRNFLAEHRITDFRGEIAGLVELHAGLSRAIDRDSLERESLLARLAQMQEEIGRYEPFLSQPSQEVALPNPNVGRLEEQLLERELELQEIKARAAGGPNTQIRDKEQQIAFIRQRLQEERARPAEVQRTSVMVPNPEYDRRRSTLLDMRLHLQELENSLPGRTRAREGLLERILALQRLEDRWQELRGAALRAEEQKAQIEAQLRSFFLAKDLDARGLSNLQLFESPSLEPTKEGPSREKFILVGFFGTLGALCPLLMLGLRVSTRLRRARQIEELLGVAVPASLPRLDRRNLRRFVKARNQGWV